MAIKRTKYRVGALVRKRVQVDASDSSQEAADALDEMLEGSTPRGRVANWRRIAEGNAQALGLLDQAEKLIDERGSINDRAILDQFDMLILRAEHCVQLAKIEEVIVPLAQRGQKNREASTKGGQNSHGMESTEREKRNADIQAEIDRLCIKKGLSYTAARNRVAKDFGLHPDTVKDISKNPLK